MDRIDTAIFGQQTTIQLILGHLQTHTDLMLSASTSDPQNVFNTIQQSQPQVVLLEALPDCWHVIELIDQILQHRSQTKCIILAHTLNMLHVRQAVKAGVMGYLLMPDVTDLLTSVRLVHSGKFACSPEIVRCLAASA